jgi:LacI family transcriptional regulator
MSGKGPVKQATRERVELAIQRLSYSPSASARSLRTARTMLLGVLVPDLANPVFVPFLRGVQHVAQKEGYSVLVVDVQRSVEVERRALDRLLELRVDALILGGNARDPARIIQLRRTGMTVADASAGGRGERPLIPELEAPGTVAMCEAFAALGHVRVGYVTASGGLGGTGRRRWALIQRRSQELGMGLEQIRVTRGATPDAAALVLGGAVRRARGVTALICSTLGLAPTVLRGLSFAGLQIPSDCSLATYGDSDWAAAHRPAISGVTMDLFEVATMMTQQVLGNIAGRQVDAEVLPEPARFILRESVALPPTC